jgi:FkbH-like protein
MRLVQALEILREKGSTETDTFRVALVCGFTPLHLATILNAHLRLLLGGRRVEISGGLYGDFWGNLRRLEGMEAESSVILLEWGDLDPRLGVRGLGSWGPSAFEDISKTVRDRASEFSKSIESNSRRRPIAVCFPTLPLPPVSFSPGWQASAFDLELRSCISSLALECSRIRSVRVLNSERLDLLSPTADRADVKSELISGFPYKLPHASVLADLLSRLILPPIPKKGLITDLDDTLWQGLLGEVGVHGISWDLEHQSHMHGAYQRLLHALSRAGVLIGAATKNEPAEVEEALRRRDLILSGNTIFPVEAHWGPKSQSVDRIIATWNIGLDAVVFVDDSPLELAEVRARHPDVECILFPKDDPREIDRLLRRLRDVFGKSVLVREDEIRSESIRSKSVQGGSSNGDRVSEDFLKQLDAELTFACSKEPLDPRALELVNKTNQFNLNGKRYTEAGWQKYIQSDDTILWMAAYQDKYGPLGKICVLAGRKLGKTLVLDVWTMSCRAFSRRIEHRCIEELFKRSDIDEIVFGFQSTPKNGPIREFLSGVLGEPPTDQHRLSREQFLERPVKTFHRVLEAANG